MKTLLMTIIFSLSATSCLPQKGVITIKLEGKNTGIRDVLDIDGYYQSIDSAFPKRNGYTSKRMNDKSLNCTGMMFFEDGSCCSFRFKEGATENTKRENLSQAIYSWEQKGQARWGSWGVYKIDKDTIVVQTVTKAGWFSQPWSFSEYKYEIIDSHTLKYIYYKWLPADKHDTDNPYDRSRSYPIFSEFIPADSLPSSDCWLKEEKWIWRNESDWKNYMEKIKEKKKKK